MSTFARCVCSMTGQRPISRCRRTFSIGKRLSCLERERRRRKWRSAVDTNNNPDHQPLAAPSEEILNGAAPSGVDLHPQPEKAIRISRRATVMILSVVVLLLLG